MNGINTSMIHVTKRDGSAQDFNLDKIHKVLEWATEGISNVSQSEIEIKSNIQLYDKIPAYDIHELLIKSASELISEYTPNYQFVAARLISYKLRKEVYGQYEPWSLLDIIKKNVEKFIRLETTKCNVGLTDYIFGQKNSIFYIKKYMSYYEEASVLLSERSIDKPIEIFLFLSSSARNEPTSPVLPNKKFID